VKRGYTEKATLPPLQDLGAMEAFRRQTASATRSYLGRAGEAECMGYAARSANRMTRMIWTVR